MAKMDKALDSLLSHPARTQVLTVASKLHYVVSQSPKHSVPKRDLANRASSFGWQIAATDIDAAIDFLVENEFVALN
jgi:hypothetical protein